MSTEDSSAPANNSQASSDASAPAQPDKTLATEQPAAAADSKSTETKATEAKAAEAKPDAAKEPAAPVVPEKYDLKFPEGVELDVEPWVDVFKGAKLSNEQAQAFVNKQLELNAQAGQMLDEAMAESRTEWRNAAKADKDIGGANFDSTVQNTQAFLAKFGDAELRELLDASGLGDHPAVLRAFAKAGKSLREDTVIRSNGAGTGVDAAAKLFSKSVPNQAGA